jgi:hypothetical protein
MVNHEFSWFYWSVPINVVAAKTDSIFFSIISYICFMPSDLFLFLQYSIYTFLFFFPLQ